VGKVLELFLAQRKRWNAVQILRLAFHFLQISAPPEFEIEKKKTRKRAKVRRSKSRNRVFIGPGFAGYQLAASSKSSISHTPVLHAQICVNDGLKKKVQHPLFTVPTVSLTYGSPILHLS
jgi:hypothetical protein